MLAIERRDIIVEIIQDEKKVLVSELAPKFSVTEETIRRDLENLENQGALRRTYGGAILNNGTNADMNMSNREIVNKEAKMKIAEMIVDKIQDGETIMLDSSSTALYVAKSLKVNIRNITIVTNSLRVITELQNIKNINIILAGGTLKKSSKSFVGKWAESIIKNYYVNKTIICCKALDKERGIMDSNEEDAEIKRLMAKSAQEVYLVVDSMKFDKTSFVKILDYSEIDYLYTNEEIDQSWRSLLKENNIGIHIAS